MSTYEEHGQKVHRIDWKGKRVTEKVYRERIEQREIGFRVGKMSREIKKGSLF